LPLEQIPGVARTGEAVEIGRDALPSSLFRIYDLQDLRMQVYSVRRSLTMTAPPGFEELADFLALRIGRCQLADALHGVRAAEGKERIATPLGPRRVTAER